MTQCVPCTISRWVLCRLKVAQEELGKVMAQLKEKQDRLASIEAKVNSFHSTCTLFNPSQCLSKSCILLRLQICRPAMSAVLQRRKS